MGAMKETCEDCLYFHDNQHFGYCAEPGKRRNLREDERDCDNFEYDIGEPTISLDCGHIIAMQSSCEGFYLLNECKTKCWPCIEKWKQENTDKKAIVYGLEYWRYYD